MGQLGRPQDRRRNTYFQIASSVMGSAIALTLWLATAERGFIDMLAVWLLGFYAGLFAWILIAERRLPRLRWPVRRTPWDGDPDRLAGIGVVIAFGALNLTWRSWFPARDLLASVPESRIPDSIFALRIGLVTILASAIVVLVLTIVRMAVLDARSRSEPPSEAP
jgi:hypothetical protein